MLSYHFLLDLAIILLSTKVLGILTKKVQMPQVVGALAAGVILGPAVLGILHETAFIKQLAELGVILLMSSAGLETNIKELRKTGKASLIIALFGVLVPLAAGFGLAALFNNSGGLVAMDKTQLLQNIFIGIILTATSVSITVETLRELGRLNSPAGTAILGAAVIDDILGIVALTVITSMAGSNTGAGGIGVVLLKILLFFAIAAAIGIPFHYWFGRYTNKQKQKRRYVIISFSFCLIMSYIAERFFGIADITGAFIAGLVLSNTYHAQYVERRFEILSYALLSPIFFASIGISVELGKMSPRIILFTILLVIAAVLTKVAGCGLGAMISRSSRRDSAVIGVGMVSRGEVALIVAARGARAGLMQAVYFGPVIIMVVITTIITPVLLKIVIGRKPEIIKNSS